MSKILHLSSCVSGQVLQWYSTDTNDLYINNLNDSNKRKLLEQFGWIDSTFTYNINSCGFRAPEFDLRQNFVTLGCSLTTGIGLPVEQTWPWYLSKKLKVDHWNLSVPGSSSDTAYRIAEYYLPLLNPDFVIMLEPDPGRFELFHGNSESAPENITISAPDLNGMLNNKMMKTWITYEYNQELHAIKNIKSIAYQCYKRGIDFYLYTDRYFLNFLGQRNPTYARDLMHPGRQFNEDFASAVHSDILNKRIYE